MIRLIIATLFVFGIKCNVGGDTLDMFFSLIDLNTYAGLSAASINRLENYIRELLKKYENELQPMLEKLSNGRALIAGADETFYERFMILVFMDLPSGFLFLEKSSNDRKFETWNNATAGIITLFIKLKCFVTDSAKALLKLGTHYGLKGTADLFHFLMKPVRLFKFAFSAKLKTLAKEKKQLNVALNKILDETERQVLNEKLIAIKNKTHVIKQGQTQYRQELQAISTTVHPFNLNLQQQTSEQISTKLHASVLSLREILVGCGIDDKKNALDKMEKQIVSISPTSDLWWQWVNADITLLGARLELQDAIKQILLPFIYFKMQRKKSKSKKSLRDIYQNVYEAAEKLLRSRALVSELTTGSWMKWANDMCRKFQRTTSAIEGRNGLLAGFNLCARGMTELQLESQKIIHNFWIKRDDGTTAVERCFGIKPDIDLFEFILANMKELPLPRCR